MNNLKTCTTCKQELPLTEFGNKKEAKDGLQYSCSPCIKKTWKAAYEQNKTHLKERQKAREKAQQLQEAITRLSTPNLAQPIRRTEAVTLPGTPGTYYRNLQPQHIRGI
jgi:DNA repair exonuclease SbcCD ATPase subunit